MSKKIATTPYARVGRQQPQVQAARRGRGKTSTSGAAIPAPPASHKRAVDVVYTVPQAKRMHDEGR